MSYICIRRTKEMQNERGEYLVPLPPVEMTLVPVKLDPVTRVSIDISAGSWISYFLRLCTMKSRPCLSNGSIP